VCGGKKDTACGGEKDGVGRMLCGKTGRRGRMRMESVWRCGRMEALWKIKEIRSKIPSKGAGACREGICFIGVRVRGFWGAVC